MNKERSPFTQSPFLLLIRPLLVHVPHLADYLEVGRRANLQFARLIPLKPSIPNLFRVLANSHLSKTLPWTVTDRRTSPRIRRDFMLNGMSDRLADQGGLAPVFKPFQLPSFPSGLKAPPFEICGKQELFLGPLFKRLFKRLLKVFLCMTSDSDVPRINP